MNSFEILFLWIILISIIASTTTSSCLPGVPGTCECCNSTTTCVEIPYSILPHVTPNYICISNEIVKNFSFIHCNCTLKDPSFCLCFNRTQMYPIYDQCYSFTECFISHINVKAKHEIFSKIYKFFLSVIHIAIII